MARSTSPITTAARSDRRGLVLLLCAATIAWPACARAQAGSSTLYGRLNLDVEAVGGKPPDGDTHWIRRLSSNSSMFGLRGAEYLGDGLVAVWQIESSVNADSGGGGIAMRDTYLGLDSEWGTVKLGYLLSPYDDMQPVFGSVPTLTTSILSTAAIWAQGGLAKIVGGFDARLPNSIRYDSPDWQGLSGSAQISLGEDSRNSAVYGLGAVYNAERLEAGAAWEYNHNVRGEGLDDYALTLTASWNFGQARLAGVYEYLRYGTPVGPLKRSFWGASGTLAVGAGTFYAFAGQAGDGRAPGNVRVGGLASGSDTAAWQYVLSYTYALTRRTLAYAGYVRIDNDARAAYNFYVNPYVADSPTGLELSGFVLGAAHFF